MNALYTDFEQRARWLEQRAYQTNDEHKANFYARLAESYYKSAAFYRAHPNR